MRIPVWKAPEGVALQALPLLWLDLDLDRQVLKCLQGAQTVLHQDIVRLEAEQMVHPHVPEATHLQATHLHRAWVHEPRVGQQLCRCGPQAVDLHQSGTRACQQ